MTYFKGLPNSLFSFTMQIDLAIFGGQMLCQVNILLENYLEISPAISPSYLQASNIFGLDYDFANVL